MTVTAFPIGRPGRAAPGGLRDAPFDSRTVGQLASLFTSLPRSTRMADDADQAHDNEAQHLMVSLSSINATIPEGVRGECENCGEDMPRLVGGRCGYCRDGRRPPMSGAPRPTPTPTPPPRLESQPVVSAPTPAPIAPVAPVQDVPTPPPAPVAPAISKEDAVPNPKPSDDFRNVSILARGPLLAAILKRAEDRDLSLNKAATSLIEEALTPSVVAAGETLQDLSAVSLADLVDEIVGRIEAAPSQEMVDALTKRAEAAESQLAAIQQLLVKAGPVA